MTATTATTATRPRTPSAPDPAASRRGPLRGALPSLVALGVLAGGVWGLTAPRGSAADEHAHGSAAVATVDVPDGTLRVDGLVDKSFGMVMPGMTMPDEVPAGMRRFAVDVSLGATEDGPLTYSRRDFTVSGPGVKPVGPVDGQLDSGALTPGTAISGSLSFDVPEEASALALQFRNGETIALPALPAVTGEHGEHGADEAPAGAPAAVPAAPGAPEPAADHHDAPGAPPHGH